MSRLDSAIRRLCAQRDCLGWAAQHAPDGDALEIGLGNGRTYHHLREIAPDRTVWVIDRAVNAHPSSVPPEAHLLLGEAEAMIATLAGRIGPRIALAHYDLGVGVPERDAPLAASVADALPAVLAPGAILVSNRPLPGFETLPLPDGVAEDRYFLMRGG